MKKITYLLIAAMSLVSVASCVKEMTPEEALDNGVTGQVFTISLPAATRTELVDGKTVWAKGDSVWVSNGAAFEAVVVPEEAYGKKEFDFATKTVKTSEENPQIWVVYPYDAAAGVKDGKVSVKVPAAQDGEFSSANIAAAVSYGYHVELKNVTAVMKVTIPDEAVLYSVAFTAAGDNALAGTCTVDFSGATPVLTASAPTSTVTVTLEGQVGEKYVSVIPGTFAAGFKLTAAGYSFEEASEVKEATVANTLAANDMVDLGAIGTNLGPLSGDGTQASPYLIENLGHMIAFALAVNDPAGEGNSFAGKFLKVTNDISGITMPVGYYPKAGPDAENKVNHPFKGDFDGGNHTLTLSVDGDDQPDANRVGLFGALNAGAHIHDLVIAGQVVSSLDAVGGLAGHVSAPANADPVVIENVKNTATVKGRNWAGGLIGYATSTGNNQLTIKNCQNEGAIRAASDGYCAGGIVGSTHDSQKFYKVITNCSNSGSVYANYNSGGITGSAYFTEFSECTNSGSISAASPYQGAFTYANKAWRNYSTFDRATGGITGYTQNSSVDDCSNSGTIKGVTHVGGVVGTAYWTNVTKCTNTSAGKVYTTTKNNYNDVNLTNISMIGGVVGHNLGHGNVTECQNFGEVAGFGAVGGIVGYFQGNSQSYGSANDRSFLKGCKNSGPVNGQDVGVGGIVGATDVSQFWPTVYIEDCENTGDVVGTSSMVGGIVGVARNQYIASDRHIYACVNRGNVTGTYFVGGIMGLNISRQDVDVNKYSQITFRNCENYGTILGMRKDKDGGEVAGGIAGTSYLKSYANAKTFIYNCANYGPVQYKEKSHVAGYVGGIIGKHSLGDVVNVVNAGYVGPEGGVENKAEGADIRLGSIAGLYNGGTLTNAYSAEGSCSQAVGTSSTSIDNPDLNIRSFDKYGFIEYVTIGDDFFQEIVPALNAWIGTSTAYTQWVWNGTTKTPVFVK